MSAPSYFVDHKRGEVNELRSLLRDSRVQRDPRKQREVIKKIIAYMTLGIDVSKLFNEMTQMSFTKDLVQKKMVYLYLSNYAEQNADLAIMAINTLHKDIRDEDPMVRGLALRSLCNLRLPNIAEYVLAPLRDSLSDTNAYVRKTAVLGVAKLFQKQPEVVRDSDFIDILYNMIKDNDLQVVVNCIMALNEILADEGKMAINQQIVLHLLNHLHEFNEWAQCAVLELVAKYTPADEDEMYDAMNLLEDRLQHVNAAVVLGATKVFLNFTVNHPDVHFQVFERLKAPLLTLMSSGNAELAYTILSQIEALVARAEGVFDDEYKSFFCRFNDPPYVKDKKLGILAVLANPSNCSEIMTELGEYVTDIDIQIARKATKSIGAIAIKIPRAADEAVDHLLGFLDLNTDYISAEAVIVMKDLLRKYPERHAEIIPTLQRCLKTVDEEQGKVAVLWMIGEYGEAIDDAPYFLEPLVDGFAEETSHAVRLELLTTCLKLFFKRPPEMQLALGRLLKSALEDPNQVDVRDKALLYHRLLRHDVHEAARVVNSEKVTVDAFVESDDRELQDQIFEEFNSLSVVYGKPSTAFLTGVEYQDDEAAFEAQGEGVAEINGVAPILGGDEEESPAPAPGAKQADLLSFDFYATEPVANEPAKPSLALKPNPTVDAKTFQKMWSTLPVASTIRLTLGSASDGSAIENMMAGNNIATMASGTVNNVMKFYFFAQQASDSELFFVESIVDLGSLQWTSTVKCNASNDIDGFVELFRSTVSSISS